MLNLRERAHKQTSKMIAKQRERKCSGKDDV